MLIAAVAADAFPFPKQDPPLPTGAVRRFGTPSIPPARLAKESDIEKRLGGRYPRNNPVGSAIALTPDGKHLILGSASGRIEVYELATGRLDRTLSPSGTAAIRLLTISPDGRWLAGARGRGEVDVWDLPAGKVIQTLKVRKSTDDSGQVERIAFAPDGKVLFTGSDAFTEGDNGGATAWETSTGKRLWNTPGCGYNLNSDPRGRWVLTSLIQEYPTQLTLLNARTGQPFKRLPVEASFEQTEGNLETIEPSATLDRLFTPDGSRLVSIHDDGTARVWNPDTGRELVRMKFRTTGSAEPGGLAVSPDGRWLAIRVDHSVELWEASSGKRLHAISGLTASPRELAFTRDGRGLVTSSGPDAILWMLRPSSIRAAEVRSDALWEALASEDGQKAYFAIWAVVDNPKIAVTLFSSKVRPTDFTFDRAVFDRLVAGLDSPSFGNRERAERDLLLGGFSIPGSWLAHALAKAPSEEVRTRLGRIIAVHDGPSPARFRMERAVQVLEFAHTDEAMKLLRDWAAGPKESSLTDLATASLSRIARPSQP
jgi:WD40 repeat protein